jgi:hypothetical protein
MRVASDGPSGTTGRVLLSPLATSDRGARPVRSGARAHGGCSRPRTRRAMGRTYDEAAGASLSSCQLLFRFVALQSITSVPPLAMEPNGAATPCVCCRFLKLPLYTHHTIS